MVILGWMPRLRNSSSVTERSWQLLSKRDEGLPVQLPQVYRLPLSQPVTLRDQQDDLVLTDEGPFHPGVVDFSTEEQVDLPGQQLVPQLHEGGLLVELEAHPHPVGLG